MDEYFNIIIDRHIDYLKELKELINEQDIKKAVDLISGCKSKIIFIGIGKSGIIAKRVSSSFASIGVNSCYVNAAEAGHGDLGIIKQDDIVILISNSGNSSEFIAIIECLDKENISYISITSDNNSIISKNARVNILVPKCKELTEFPAPIFSTNMLMVAADILFLYSAKSLGISQDLYRRNHPSGKIGFSMLMVKDLMRSGDDIPIINPDDAIDRIVYEVSSKMLGLAVVVSDNMDLIGIITDGDLRRAIQSNLNNISKLKAIDICSKKPRVINPEELVSKAIEYMSKNKITSLIVSKDSKKMLGIIRIHDIISTSIFK